MFSNSSLRVSIPVSDMARATDYYTSRLGLQVAHESEYGVLFDTGGGSVSLTPSPSAGQGGYSLLTWVVANIDATVARLRANGVMLEDYDLPGVVMHNGIADFGGDRVAWFKDSEGNILAVAQLAG